MSKTDSAVSIRILTAIRQKKTTIKKVLTTAREIKTKVREVLTVANCKKGRAAYQKETAINEKGNASA